MLMMLFGLGLARAPGDKSQAWAFSPYENYLHSGEDTRVGLIARAQAGREADARIALQRFEQPSERESLSKRGIHHLSCFSRKIGPTTWLFVHFQFSGNQEYGNAANAFEAATPAVARLHPLIEPASGEGSGGRWTQMEWICFIRGKQVDGPPRQRKAMVTTLRPEKELQYRTMHQTVWPGVVDQMILRNNRNVSAFLCDLDGDIFEFLYVEYVGADADKDSALSQQDPVNRRWMKLTDECQKALPGEAAIWSEMELVTAKK